MDFLVFALAFCLSFKLALPDQLSSRCGEGWVSGTSGFCYWFSDARLSWSDASKECWKLDSVLLRLYRDEDLTSVIAFVNRTQTTRWWTDLNDYHTTGIWVWGQDGTSAQAQINLIKWNLEPDDKDHLENCGALNFQAATSDERCGDKYSYICEYEMPAGTQCLNGWFSYKTGCYNLVPIGDPWNLVTWSQANQTCSTILQGTAASNPNSHLLFIETRDELAYIRKMLPMVPMTSQLWWIGMTDIQQEGKFVWTDGTSVDTTKTTWAFEPNDLGAKEQCGVMYRNGEFADLNCNNTENFICMQENIDKSFLTLTKLGCPSRWMRAGQSCYLIEADNKLSWQDAKLFCGQHGAWLLKVDSPDERMWLEMQTLTIASGKSYWTGLNNKEDQSVWRWADGSKANTSLIKWNSEPNNYNGDEDCATISQTGDFNDVPCLSKNSFICELQTEDSPCPNGWLSMNSGDQMNCYYIGNTTVTKDEARSTCQQLSSPMEAYMWAPNDQPELSFVVDHLRQMPQTDLSWFTGLTDSGHEGFWAFDTSFNPLPDPGFIPWSTFPHYVNMDENCAFIIYGGAYINRKCSIEEGYICEKPAYGFTDTNASPRILIRDQNFMLLVFLVTVHTCLYL